MEFLLLYSLLVIVIASLFMIILAVQDGSSPGDRRTDHVKQILMSMTIANMETNTQYRTSRGFTN
jgi:hypothetical protein